MSGLVLGLLAFVLFVQAGFVWIRSIREVRTGERRTLVLLVVMASIGLALLAFARGPGWIGGLGAGIAAFGGALFLLLQMLGKQTKATPAVAVGGEILDFTAQDAEGRPFALGSLRGRPYLLKFFRGHW